MFVAVLLNVLAQSAKKEDIVLGNEHTQSVERISTIQMLDTKTYVANLAGDLDIGAIARPDD